MAKIRAVLDQQKHELLARMEAIIEQRKKHQSEEEKKIQEKLKRIGRCPMDFEWLKVEGGYRCAGSHFFARTKKSTHFVLDRRRRRGGFRCAGGSSSEGTVRQSTPGRAHARERDVSAYLRTHDTCP